MNIRVWKANAAEKLGPLTKREKQAFAYNEKLRDTYKNHPEVRRIAKHRNVPRHIFTWVFCRKNSEFLANYTEK